jgi:hypothetical protein
MMYACKYNIALDMCINMFILIRTHSNIYISFCCWNSFLFLILLPLTVSSIISMGCRFILISCKYFNYFSFINVNIFIYSTRMLFPFTRVHVSMAMHWHDMGWELKWKGLNIFVDWVVVCCSHVVNKGHIGGWEA